MLRCVQLQVFLLIVKGFRTEIQHECQAPKHHNPAFTITISLPTFAAMTKIVSVVNIACGESQLFLISGPCVIEERDTMWRTAEHLRGVQESLDLPIIFKSYFQNDNRSSVEY
jgi:3-deoxy-D-arabino-heptulosonate 7-phosphate (DAHP) synthase